ncbi:MAG TPA: CBS domain-containing protein, partial [Bacillota bacterium]|nr:CBS domain-containing protein [Bacillota bacterium]
IEIDGLDIIMSSSKQPDFIGGLALVTEKMLAFNGAAAVINVVEMNDRVFIVGRASSQRVSLLPILKKWGGGGHRHAGSAQVKHGDRLKIYETIKENIEEMLLPAVTAKDLMTYPVKTISPDTTIERAGNLMYRYGHSGYPVVENDQLVGLISRRDLDKANHHGLGHAPVKAYMSTDIITLTPEDTLEEIQQTVIDHNVGRLPVLADGELVGILTRTNIIEAIHSEAAEHLKNKHVQADLQENIQEQMAEQLPESIYTLLHEIGSVAQELNINTYLVGGIVRDIFLKQTNDDIDIVVEGDGIYFAKQLQQTYGGEIITHEEFGTATWRHPAEQSIDIASSRLEYYKQPASLPDVERSTLKEDLQRRDFTMNAMAICLNNDQFGTVVDPFFGQKDLLGKKVKVLHNLSFVEDPTRIFRAIRFEARFDFHMDEQTKKLALHSIDKINNLSKNRILDEMNLLFTEVKPAQVIKRLFAVNFWQQFSLSATISQASEQHANHLAQIFAKKDIQKLSIKTSSSFKYFLIPFYYGEKLSLAKSFALKKYERKLIAELVNIVHDTLGKQRQLGDIHRLLKGVMDDTILFLMANEQLMNRHLLFEYLFKRQSIPQYVTGEDLLAKGIKRGPIYAQLLFQLEIAILNGEIQSKEEALNWLHEKMTKDTN